MKQTDIPIWERYTLTIEEASKYFRIGENKLRRLAEENKNANWLIMNGNRIQIKRKQFEKIIDIEEIYDCVLNNIKQYGKIIKKDISETYATKDQISALESNVDTKVSRLKTQIESLKAQVESLKTQVESLKNPTP